MFRCFQPWMKATSTCNWQRSCHICSCFSCATWSAAWRSARGISKTSWTHTCAPACSSASSAWASRRKIPRRSASPTGRWSRWSWTSSLAFLIHLTLIKWRQFWQCAGNGCKLIWLVGLKRTRSHMMRLCMEWVGETNKTSWSTPKARGKINNCHRWLRRRIPI